MPPSFPDVPAPAPRRRLAWIGGLVLILSCILLGGYWIKTRLQPSYTNAPPSSATQPAMFNTAPLALFADPHHALPSTSDLMGRQKGDQPLASEPAGLVAPSGGQRVAGIRRSYQGFTEEIAFWRFPHAALDALAGHYRQQARQAGYTVQINRTPASAPADRGVDLVLMQSDGQRLRMDRILTINIRPDPPDAANVVIWLSYPAPG